MKINKKMMEPLDINRRIKSTYNLFRSVHDWSVTYSDRSPICDYKRKIFWVPFDPDIYQLYISKHVCMSYESGIEVGKYYLRFNEKTNAVEEIPLN